MFECVEIGCPNRVTHPGQFCGACWPSQSRWEHEEADSDYCDIECAKCGTMFSEIESEWLSLCQDCGEAEDEEDLMLTKSKHARSMFAEYGIDVDAAPDAAVVRAYNSILEAAAITARPADHFFCAIRNLNDFAKQPRLDPKWNLNLDELLPRGK